MFGFWRGAQLLERIVEHPIFTTSRIFGTRPQGWNPTGIRTGRFWVKAFRKGPSLLRWAGDNPLAHTRSRYIFGGKYKTDERLYLEQKRKWLYKRGKTSVKKGEGKKAMIRAKKAAAEKAAAGPRKDKLQK